MKKQPTYFEDILEKRWNRRSFIGTSALATLSLSLTGCKPEPTNTPKTHTKAHKTSRNSTLPFKELPLGLSDTLEVAENYHAQTLIRWGDPIFSHAAEFDPYQQTAEKQREQFGFNNDFVGFLPLPYGSKNSRRGLLTVNHEYTNTELMFPGAPVSSALTQEQTEIDIAAHGLSIFEVEKTDSGWRIVKDSSYNRRITPNTPATLNGASAGNKRLHTQLSNDGIHTLGTYGNCAGGVTPWGTILTGEENVDYFFEGDPTTTREAENYARFHTHTNNKSWGKYFDRWHINKNPNEPLHMGWVVEIDPYKPNSKPKKRTSLGRCKHEGCNVYINKDNTVVAYTGDDQRFEYIYKFVCKNKYEPTNREANLDLLDEGTLYVAKFHDDGVLEWLPLVYGQSPLTEKHGFNSQADVCLDARKAADFVAATKMDRPEDIEVNPQNGHVYAMLTNNSKRKKHQTDSANPRPYNSHGQIIEFWPESGNHAATTFKWDLFLLAGNPKKDITHYHPATSENGWLSCPDNCAFDNKGNLWIATDGANKSGIADGLWATEVSGENKARPKHFMHVPHGAELCGPFFTPDTKNLFLSIQHPADGSTFEAPSTRWPDFKEDVPARPAVVVITNKDTKIIGS